MESSCTGLVASACWAGRPGRAVQTPRLQGAIVCPCWSKFAKKPVRRRGYELRRGAAAQNFERSDSREITAQGIGKGVGRGVQNRVILGALETPARGLLSPGIAEEADPGRSWPGVGTAAWRAAGSSAACEALMDGACAPRGLAGRARHAR